MKKDISLQKYIYNLDLEVKNYIKKKNILAINN